MLKAVFFDLNDTLLDLTLLKTTFSKYFDNELVYKYWLTKLLHISTVLGGLNEYQNFDALSETVLEIVFSEYNILLTEEIKNDILTSFKNLNAYNDVSLAFDFLKTNKVRILIIANSSLDMTKEQLTNTKIIDNIDNYYSVETVKKYKPFEDIYLYATGKEGLSVNEVAMISTHDWDLFGAKKAGLKTGYIQRKKTMYNPYFTKADVSNTDLLNLVTELVKI